MTAARHALEVGDVDLVLPFVPADGEPEVREVFERVIKARGLGPEARDTADLLFFETVVRIHRAGEGAPYTGLKPAGLDVGPVLPLAERAVEGHSPDELADFLSDVLREELSHRLHLVEELEGRRADSVEEARSYVEAMLGFEVYSHHLYQAMRATEHHEGAAHAH
ncbi:MAG TPA: DUF6448 family protein [Nocardioidaceae bacterium]|nr:DUF6448 family protein [Nocardioidaceae bacterium]